MAAWQCTGCTAVYSVGAPRCPQCGEDDHIEEGQPMPKITVHGGPSIAGASVVGGAWSDNDTPDTWPNLAADEEGGEEPSPSSSSSPSPEKPSPGTKTSGTARRKPARTTGSRSKQGRTESSSAGSTDGGPTADSSDD